jgi:hypothetical protein
MLEGTAKVVGGNRYLSESCGTSPDGNCKDKKKKIVYAIIKVTWGVCV